MSREKLNRDFEDQISNIRYIAGKIRGSQFDDGYVALKDAAAGFERLLNGWNQMVDKEENRQMCEDWR